VKKKAEAEFSVVDVLQDIKEGKAGGLCDSNDLTPDWSTSYLQVECSYMRTDSALGYRPTIRSSYGQPSQTAHTTLVRFRPFDDGQVVIHNDPPSRAG
jgi:hypothetical protein